MATALLYATLGALALYQLYVSLKVISSIGYSRKQKSAQFALIWLLPFLGAVACHVFISAEGRPTRKDAAFTSDAGNNPPGVGPGDLHH
jgi:hypothetical protein